MDGTGLLRGALSLLFGALALAWAADARAETVYRVNAGGPELAGTPAWTADTSSSPSPLRQRLLHKVCEAGTTTCSNEAAVTF